MKANEYMMQVIHLPNMYVTSPNQLYKPCYLVEPISLSMFKNLSASLSAVFYDMFCFNSHLVLVRTSNREAFEGLSGYDQTQIRLQLTI